MAPFRGRGRGRGRGVSSLGGRLARSGIRTRGGQYKKFDSQRTRDLSDEEDEVVAEPDRIEFASDIDDDAEDEEPALNAYSSLVASLKSDQDELHDRPTKRRRLSGTTKDAADAALPAVGDFEDEDLSDDDDGSLSHSLVEVDDDVDDEPNLSDPYERHFNRRDEEITPAIESISSLTRKKSQNDIGTIVHESLPVAQAKRPGRPQLDHIKRRLQTAAQKILSNDEVQQTLEPYLFDYIDVVYANRTVDNASRLRQLSSLHAINHILKGSNKIVKHNARLAQAEDDETLEFRDQGFTRPKVLILCETRQMAVKYAEHIVEAFAPQQQENRRRFLERFSAPIEHRDMPDDFNELFEGNNDNDFRAGIKLTRKALKFNTKFYSSDIILASPVGLRKIVEHEESKKRDRDFLSSIEILILDQADAIQMQSADNLDFVFKHLNLLPSQLRDADMNRVRQFYLDGLAKHFRQTIIFSSYLTPEINMLYSRLVNVAGKISVVREYPGVLQAISNVGVKQSFSRFDAKTPVDVPDGRFGFFTTSVLPALTRLPQPGSGGKGILIFIPQYYDFVRVRRYFAETTLSFGSISEYTDVSGSNGQRSIRAKFEDGRMSFLLYSGRAHHFFRLRIRGVKRVVFYELPDNPIFYDEIAGGYLGSSIERNLVSSSECTVRSLFSKFDSMKLERVVGTTRVKPMLSNTGDVFEFV